MNVEDLAIRFSEKLSHDGYSFDCQLIPGEQEVLQVCLDEYDEIPVYITFSETQILCIIYLWAEDEIKEEMREELHTTLLDMNLLMPLSSFSRIGQRYIVFGALSINSSFEEVAHEISTLTENAIEAISSMEEYLI